MAKYLIERVGAGKFAVGEIVDLTDKQADFYKSKIKLIKQSEAVKLEVATPKPKPDESPKPKFSSKKKSKAST